ncbi:hypothetical protein [Vallicoccus soli]|uniref:Uncharacterized protein n=1 Tax=Vallicoccus soli TaxID=2339232 RepID=A0A3A3Z019_9ACTN|nr:hypothetical protein [Vallicoccus soli]RJK94792.1 hypothetical protein D5H78_13305 [Vallicoccus soli]
MQLVTRGPLRLARAAAVAAACTLLPAAGHLGAGGPAPGGALLAAGALVLAACLALSGARWTTRRLGAVALVAQAGVHALLTGAAAGPGAALREAADPVMAAGHAVGALALAVVLVRGEDALWDAGAGVAAALGRTAPPAVPAQPPVPGEGVVRPAAPAPPPAPPAPRPLVRRGPPRVPAAARG